MKSPKLRFFWRRMTPVSSRASNCSLMAAEAREVSSLAAVACVSCAIATNSPSTVRSISEYAIGSAIGDSNRGSEQSSAPVLTQAGHIGDADLRRLARLDRIVQRPYVHKFSQIVLHF